MPTEQRFVFDEVADAYARVRPGYPAQLIDDVLDYVGGPSQARRMLEIGCGGGQATVAFALRDLAIEAVEPGDNLARCARERLAQLKRAPGANPVDISTTTFEDYRLPATSFDLVIAAQAFHWVAPEVRFSKSAEALRRGGVLAVFANAPQHPDVLVHKQIQAAYDECAPSMLATPPASDACTASGSSIAREFANAPQFCEVEERSYPWEAEYRADAYVELMTTQSNHRLLPKTELDSLLAAIRDAIKGAGGSLTVPYVAHLVMGRRI